MTELELADEVRAGVVAHAIRLGKRLTPGMVVDFLVQMEMAEEADLHAGRLDKFTPTGEAVRCEFTVEQRDIDNGIALINSQRASYREPKTTTVKLA